MDWKFGVVALLVISFVVLLTQPATADPLLSLSLSAIVAFMYLFPSFVAFNQRHPQLLGIFLLNLVVGWTVFGWIIALIWAFAKPATAHR